MGTEDGFSPEKPQLPLENVPIIGKQIKDLAHKIDQTVATEGLSSGIKRTLEQRGAQIGVRYDSTVTSDYLHQSGKPLIVISTHSSVAEPLVVLSALSQDTEKPRDDIKAIVADALIGYPHLSRYFLPLYNTVSENLHRPKSLGGGEHIDPRKAARLNIENLNLAATELKNGKLIFISPEGQLPKDSPWSSAGIGRLITNIGMGSNGHIIFADAKGVNKLELGKLINPLKSPKPFQNTLVNFSQPLSIDEIISANGNRNGITSDLNHRYNDWIKTHR